VNAYSWIAIAMRKKYLQNERGHLQDEISCADSFLKMFAGKIHFHCEKILLTLYDMFTLAKSMMRRKLYLHYMIYSPPQIAVVYRALSVLWANEAVSNK